MESTVFSPRYTNYINHYTQQHMKLKPVLYSTILATTLVCCFMTVAYGQSPKQIKKVSEITTTFDDYFVKGGKLYLSKKGKVRKDTLVTAFITLNTKKFTNTNIINL